MVSIERVAWGGWPNCYRIENGTAELIVTSDVGPRVMRYAFAGGKNILKEYEATLGSSGEASWQLRGGHRLWIGPEDARYTYAPDNGPVAVSIRDGVLTAVQPVEPLTGIEKQLSVALAAEGTSVTVTHQLRNTNVFSVELAPWSPSMMAPGGIGITGYPPRGTHGENLKPTNPLVMWAYTNLADPRWRYTFRYLALRQEPGNEAPQKLGLFNEKTWGAYLLEDQLFVKRMEANPARAYPEFHCSFEIFTNADMLELETLGPLTRLEPEATVTHVERWSLSRGVAIPEWTDEALDRVLLPLL